VEAIYTITSNTIYPIMALTAGWGLFCALVVWQRIRQKQFRTEALQNAFLEAIEEPLSKGDFQGAFEVADGDRRAICQLACLAIENRKLGFGKVKQLLVDRFQRDVLQDLDFRLSWVVTVIKTGPMLGLLGTVLGMMAAFAKLAGPEGKVEVSSLASDISFALITTIIGLLIAIPLSIILSAINIRIRKMEDITSYGINQFLEVFRQALIKYPTS
jgi:biopolymer transport protein ExbB/TolQ